MFGRKINNSEHQLTFVTYLHAIANGKIKAEEAVRAYHGDLQKLQLKPYRELKSDLELTINASSYAGTSTTASPTKAKKRRCHFGGNVFAARAKVLPVDRKRRLPISKR